MFKILMASLAFTACGSKHVIQGGTENYAQTQSTISGEVRVVIEVDVTMCEGLYPDAKLQCILALLDTLKELKDLSSLVKAGEP